jgi:hypothetical protein
MGHRDARSRGSGERARHAGHDIERHARRPQGQRLFSAPAEDERIAALQPHHAPAALRGANHHGMDVFLGQGVTPGALADEETLRAAGNLQDALVDEGVVQHQIGGPQPGDGSPGQQPRIAWPRSDQRHMTRHRRDTSSVRYNSLSVSSRSGLRASIGT